MQKVLVIGLIGLPLVGFLALFGNDIMVTFIERENAQIDAENQMLDTLVEGSGFRDGSGWSVAE
jgi:hypothetical protein